MSKIRFNTEQFEGAHGREPQGTRRVMSATLTYRLRIRGKSRWFLRTQTENYETVPAAVARKEQLLKIHPVAAPEGSPVGFTYLVAATVEPWSD